MVNQDGTIRKNLDEISNLCVIIYRVSGNETRKVSDVLRVSMHIEFNHSEVIKLARAWKSCCG